MSLFGINDGLQLKIVKRGSPPLGGGLIQFDCPNLRSIKPLVFSEKGKIKRIRGIAYVFLKKNLSIALRHTYCLIYV